MEYGLVGLVVLILDVLVIMRILQSSAKSEMKLVWVLVIVFLPVVGLIAWWLAGPGRR